MRPLIPSQPLEGNLINNKVNRTNGCPFFEGHCEAPV